MQLMKPGMYSRPYLPVVFPGQVYDHCLFYHTATIYHRAGFNSLIIAFVSFSSYIANLIIASAQIARRDGLLIE